MKNATPDMSATSDKRIGRRPSSGLCAILATALISGCGDGLFVGSDVLWTARHEGGDFQEWTGVAGGGIEDPSPNVAEISDVQAHSGRFAAKLTVTTAQTGVQETAVLGRAGGLPIEAYYSAWYYLPQPVSVGVFWVIMKFRVRSVPDDAATSGELFDLDLRTLPSGAMSLRLFDFRTGANVPFETANPDPVVPVQQWFHVEAFYRNAQDISGRLTYWLNGTKVVDMQGMAMAPNSWVGWQAGSVAENLTPATSVLYMDDAAISRTRVGPGGVIAR